LPEIAILLYEGMTALDAVGPYEVLARLPGAEIKFVPAVGDAAAVEWPRGVRESSKVITAAGVSAGIDMALRLAAMEAGEDEARAR
jgi:putative intracellular protease/amidase